MKTHYTPRSSYYATEIAFRETYDGDPTLGVYIEVHAKDWCAATKADSDVIGSRLLGYRGGYGKPGNRNRLWIVARHIATETVVA